MKHAIFNVTFIVNFIKFCGEYHLFFGLTCKVNSTYLIFIFTRAAKTMRGARGKTFEWGLMTSPCKTIHVISPQALKVYPVFQAPFPVQFIYLLHFFVLGALHWLGPGANCPPLSASLILTNT